MDPILYKYAQDGTLGVLRQYNNQLHKQLDPNNNNLLHVSAQFHDSAKFVDKILNDTQSSRDKRSMLTWKNSEGETALHIASRNRRSNIVQVLIQHAQALDSEDLESGVKISEEMMRASDQNGDTALHLAVRNNDKEVAELLLINDPHFKHPTNNMKETPLYLALERDNHEIVNSILTICTSQNYEGPDGKTALHAAVLSGCRGNVGAMEELLNLCPDCWVMVTSEGQNVLHLLVEYEEEGILEFILRQKWAINLINQKDAEGNTPLDLLKKLEEGNLVIEAWSLHLKISLKTRVQSPPSIDTDKRDWDERKKKTQSKREELKQRTQTRLKELRERAGTHLLVATLIATVTFAAGFTLPGGYDGNQGDNQGMAVLIKKAAFKTFVVTDTIAVMFSITAVFLHFSSTFYQDEDKLYHRHIWALLLIVIAMMTMVIAFITGLYTVLHGSSALAISVCVVGCFAILVFCYMIKRDGRENLFS